MTAVQERKKNIPIRIQRCIIEGVTPGVIAQRQNNIFNGRI
jgi:hypothetical protein